MTRDVKKLWEKEQTHSFPSFALFGGFISWVQKSVGTGNLIYCFIYMNLVYMGWNWTAKVNTSKNTLSFWKNAALYGTVFSNGYENCNKNKDVYSELYHCNELYMKNDNFLYSLKTWTSTVICQCKLQDRVAKRNKLSVRILLINCQYNLNKKHEKINVLLEIVSKNSFKSLKK